MVEEADECVYWIELFEETGFRDKKELKWLATESFEILKVCAKIKSSLAP